MRSLNPWLRFPRIGWVLVQCVVASFVAIPSSAQAHFLWLTGEITDKKPVVEAFLSETPVPDSAEFLKHIANSKITAGQSVLNWEKGEDTYRVVLPEPTPKVIDGLCDLGVMTRGGSSFRLVYTARVQFSAATKNDSLRDDRLRLRLLERPGRAAVVQATFNGKPASEAVIKAYPDKGELRELKADKDGYLEADGVAEGKTGLLAKWVVNEAGEVDGKSFKETRYYATLTVVAKPSNTDAAKAGAPARDDSHPTAPVATAPFALLPEALNSFGGAVSGDWLYVYSGHTSETHKYNNGTTSAHFRRLNLKDRTTWEELPCGPALQGVTLLAHAGKLYRIGGAAAKNKPGEPEDLTSVADFACFDPRTKTWTDLPKLPAPRSTHDAVVAGEKVYVIGGWKMDGGAANSEFSEDALVFDLAKSGASWEKLPAPPFQRRALAVAEHKGKIYVLGGLTENGNVVKDVDIYDPANRRWSKGPEMPGSKLQGFAASAFGVQGHLYVSGHDGLLHRLSDDGERFEVAGRLGMPRLTHRLLPGIANDLLAVGGTFATTPVRFIESLLLEAKDTKAPKVLTWTVPITADARQGQALALVRSKLVVAGGNRSSQPHAFEASNLVREAALVSLGRLDAEKIENLPESRQSAAMATVTSGRNTDCYLLGGIGPDGAITRTLGTVFKLDTKSGTWAKASATIPDERGLFGTAVYKNAIWLFGGNVWDPRPGHPETALVTDVLRWDPSSDRTTFETTGQKIPRPRRSFAGAVFGTKYYLVGGLGGEFEPVDGVDVFDFEKATWSTIPAPSKPRLFAELTELGGKLYLAGGYIKGGADHFTPAPSIEVYDPASETWSTLMESSPIPPAHLRMLAVQGRLLLSDLSQAERGHVQFALIAP
jgi:N-acetylneuraminic acid mutarotase